MTSAWTAGTVPRLLVLTDRAQLPLGRSLRSCVAALAAAGIRDVLLRELDLAAAARAALARDLADAGARVIAARTPLPGCVGVQLAADQPSDDAAGLPFGRSCHGRADLHHAAAEGAGWALLSPYAATRSKPGYGPPLPPDAFAAAPLPVLALGGITAAHAAEARAAGAHGVAVMGAVMRAADPVAVAARIHAGVQERAR